MGHKQSSRHVRVMSTLPPITDVGRHIQVSIWLSVCEYTPLGLSRGSTRRTLPAIFAERYSREAAPPLRDGRQKAKGSNPRSLAPLLFPCFKIKRAVAIAMYESAHSLEQRVLGIFYQRIGCNHKHARPVLADS
jgi:hypothetical protein